MQKTIPIRGMHCRSCELLLEDALGNIQGVEKVKGNFKKGCLIIQHGADIPSEQEIIRAVRQVGYEVGEPGKLPWITKDNTDIRYIVWGSALLVVLYFALRNSSLFSFNLVGQEVVSTSFAILVGLVAGVSTCMALVGGLVLGVAARHAELHPEASGWEKFRPHLFFNAGRVIGYAFFGGLLGWLGSFLQLSPTFLAILTIAVGLIMITLGIKLTNLSPRIAAQSITLPPTLARWLGVAEHQKEYSHKAAFVSGVLTFFLPCGFTQAMQVYAIGTGDAQTGAVILGAFALGTAPALLGIGGLSSVMKGTAARVFSATVGVLVMVIGLYNIQNTLSTISISLSSNTPPVVTGNTPTAPQEAQVIRMTQTGSGYSPTTLRVKAGIPVRWIINSQSAYTCASSLVVPSLGIRRNLQPGENIIEFTPTGKGTIPYSCSMGMYRGTIVVE